MATAADIRARVRTRLEESTPAVWTDSELDECVTGALETYGHLFPIDAIATSAVVDGTTATAVPTGALTIQRVILADGYVVPRRSAPIRATSDEELAWESQAGQIWFTQPLDAQTITVWHTATATLASLPVSDEGIVVLGAVVKALEVRAIQDYKRGGQLTFTSSDEVISYARSAFERALCQRRRRIQGSSVAHT